MRIRCVNVNVTFLHTQFDANLTSASCSMERKSKLRRNKCVDVGYMLKTLSLESILYTELLSYNQQENELNPPNSNHLSTRRIR